MAESGGWIRGRCWQGGLAPGEGTMEEPEVRVGAGAGLDRYRLVQHLVRKPWNSQGVGLGARADAGLDRYRVTELLVREPWKS